MKLFKYVHLVNQILRIAVPTPLPRLFDYCSNPEIPIVPCIGLRVIVSFNRREIVGIIWEISSSTDVSSNKLKTVIAYLDEEPVIDKELYTLLHWAQAYYHHPIGEVLFTALPNALCKGKPVEQVSQIKPVNKPVNVSSEKLPLNSNQQDAFQRIKLTFNQFQVSLLQGVTGSGKTEVYLQLIAELLSAGKQVLLLVPEIGLTPQTVSRFQARFDEPVWVFHSGMTNLQCLRTWALAKKKKASIVIGTRSAVFIPFDNLGLIIMDESHDLSFKQQDGWRYSARDIAIKRASLLNIPILLGTATPTLECLANVEKGRYQALYLPTRAGCAVLPTYHVLDIRNQRLQSGLSSTLIKMIAKHLDQGNQVLIFLNRRGFAPSLVCHQCGWTAKCQRCDVNMTLHLNPYYLQCHHCCATRRVTQECDACHHTDMIPLGLGTERLEEGLHALFPRYKIVRIDRDTTKRKGDLSEKLASIHSGECQILIGTQMLAKGHHFPQVTLVAILEIDSGLYSAEFRACERLAQLIEQVAGRAGRVSQAGDVVLQTHCPEHPIFQILLPHGYSEYAKKLLQERYQANLPPYSYLALLRAEASDASVAESFLITAKKTLMPFTDAFHCLGPIPAPLSKKADRYRAQLLLQSSQRQVLHEKLDKLAMVLGTYSRKKQLRWSLDVDPQELC